MGVFTESANLRLELLHENGAQNNVGGIEQLTAFGGDPRKDPPTTGAFQNALSSQAKLIFPDVPPNTVINTRDHTMWLIQPVVLRPGFGGAPSVLCLPPPRGDVAGRPMVPPTVVEVHGLRWNSPTLAQANALLRGSSGNVNEWLTANTKAEAPETPTSPGFPDYLIKRRNDCNGRDTGEIAWTGEYTGKSRDINGINYSIYYSFNLRNGKILDDTEIMFNHNWLLVDRELKPGEQYYWYPNQ